MFLPGSSSSQQQQQQPASGNFFGAVQKPASNLFGNPYNSFGSTNTTQQASMLPGIAQPMTGIPYPKETKFSDLPNETRASLEAIEKQFQQSMEQSASLSYRPYTECTKLQGQICHFEERLVAGETANETFRGHALSSKRVLNQYWKYGEGVARMVVASRPKTAGVDGIPGTWIPVITPADTFLFDEMLSRIEGQLIELMDVGYALSNQLHHLQNLNNRFNMEILRNTMKQQFDLFMKLSSRVVLAQEDLEKLKSSYKSFLSKYRNDNRDPFAPKVTLSNLKSNLISNEATKPPYSLPPPAASGAMAIPRPPGGQPFMFGSSNNADINANVNKRSSIPALTTTLSSQPTNQNPFGNLFPATPNPFLQTPK